MMQCQKKVAAVLEYLIEQQPRKLTDIIVRLPRMGVGRQFTRTTWLIQDKKHQVKPAYWTITKVIPTKNMARFKIWGEFCPRDSPSSAVRSVRSPEKYEWLLLPKDYSNEKLDIQAATTESMVDAGSVDAGAINEVSVTDTMVDKVSVTESTVDATSAGIEGTGSGESTLATECSTEALVDDYSPPNSHTPTKQ